MVVNWDVSTETYERMMRKLHGSDFDNFSRRHVEISNNVPDSCGYKDKRSEKLEVSTSNSLYK